MTVEVAASRAATHNQPVLLVEDNELNRLVADGMLRLLGYSSQSAVDGEEAVRALRNNDYQIVLMDVQMPGLDGFEATRRIRAEFPQHRQPYIIALTANAMSGDAERCRAAGMDDYLSKPISKAALGAAIDRAYSALGRQPS